MIMFVVPAAVGVEALSFCFKSLDGHLAGTRGAETQGLLHSRTVPRTIAVGLNGPLGRVHIRRVAHPARPVRPVNEGPEQAGAEW